MWLECWIVRQLNHHIVKLLDNEAVDLSYGWSVGLLDCQAVGFAYGWSVR